MKKLVMFLLAAGLFASGCKKEDEKIEPIVSTGSFTVDGKTYIADEAYWTRAQGLMLMNTPGSTAEVYNTLTFYVDSLSFSDRFEFLNINDPAFDNRKHFSGVEIRYNLSDAGEGVEINRVTAGTLTVSQSGPVYNLTYELTIDGKEIKGSYSGRVNADFPE